MAASHAPPGAIFGATPLAETCGSEEATLDYVEGGRRRNLFFLIFVVYGIYKKE